MKKVFITFFLIFFMSMLLMTSDSLLMAKEQSYPMVCKGGGSMKLQYLDQADFDGNQNAFGVIYFAKAPSAASQKEPGPGECAWLDRPIDVNEPAKASRRFAGNHIFDITIELNKISIARYEDKAGNLQNLVDAVYNGKLFYFRCKRDGEYFEITQWGP